MVQDDGPVGLDGVRVVFDDERVVSDAGVMLVATLARAAGDRGARAAAACGCGATGRAPRNAGRKVMALLYAMVLGADSIDDCDVLRAGRTRPAAGRLGRRRPRRWGRSCARSRSGTCASSTGCSAEALERAWKAGAGPGDGRLVDRCRQLRRRGLRLRRSRAPPTATPQAAAITRSSPPAPTRARRCTSACARARRTRSAGSCASATS